MYSRICYGISMLVEIAVLVPQKVEMTRPFSHVFVVILLWIFTWIKINYIVGTPKWNGISLYPEECVEIIKGQEIVFFFLITVLRVLAETCWIFQCDNDFS